jgi:hypothetical protein
VLVFLGKRRPGERNGQAIVAGQAGALCDSFDPTMLPKLVFADTSALLCRVSLAGVPSHMAYNIALADRTALSRPSS